jgi:ribosomal protein S15P/S13E
VALIPPEARDAAHRRLRAMLDQIVKLLDYYEDQAPPD